MHAGCRRRGGRDPGRVPGRGGPAAEARGGRADRSRGAPGLPQKCKDRPGDGEPGPGGGLMQSDGEVKVGGK